MNEQIKEAMTAWDIKKDVAEYIKERMGMKSEGSDKIHAEEIIDNIISKAKTEDKPEWTNLLLNQIKEDKVQGGGASSTVYNIAATVTNETLEKLINVTPVEKKTKIEELI